MLRLLVENVDFQGDRLSQSSSQDIGNSKGNELPRQPHGVEERNAVSKPFAQAVHRPNRLDHTESSC